MRARGRWLAAELVIGAALAALLGACTSTVSPSAAASSAAASPLPAGTGPVPTGVASAAPATGSATIVGVGSAPDLLGVTRVTTTTVQVVGPTSDEALRCEFSGPHMGGVGVEYSGWTVYVRVPDLAAGTSTQVACKVSALIGSLSPSHPVVDLVPLGALPTPRPGTEVSYEPAGAWPSPGRAASPAP